MARVWLTSSSTAGFDVFHCLFLCSLAESCDFVNQRCANLALQSRRDESKDVLKCKKARGGHAWRVLDVQKRLCRHVPGTGAVTSANAASAGSPNGTRHARCAAVGGFTSPASNSGGLVLGRDLGCLLWL